MTELKPCPFCGGEAEILRIGGRRQSTQYNCTMCGCFLETGEEWGHGATWNRRAALTDAEATIAALTQANAALAADNARLGNRVDDARVLLTQASWATRDALHLEINVWLAGGDA